MALVLVLGGVRSGKSELAERIVAASGSPVAYVATALPQDPEMAVRIARHKARRPGDWETIEGRDPIDAVEECRDKAVLIDGLGCWIAALMEYAEDDEILARSRRLAELASRRPLKTVVVAEEAGLGLLPPRASARRFLDLLGEATRILADHAERVVLVVAGRAVELKPRSLGLSLGLYPEELRLHGDSMAPHGYYDFAVNVYPDAPPRRLYEALTSALEDISRYPDETPAVYALADRHGRDPSEVLLLNGSAEAFWLLAQVLSPSCAVVVHPFFTEAEAALSAFGRPVERVFRDPESFAFDTERIPPEADLVVLGNPNNPTGNLEPAEALVRLVRPGRVVLIDEAFMEFTGTQLESLAERSELPGVLVLRSLTKLWSVPGLRAGYLLGPAELISALRAARQPWAVNTLACAALAACARQHSRVFEVAEKIAGWRETLIAGLLRLQGIRVWPSHANFVLVRVPDGPRIRQGLLERKIAVRRADTFPGLGPDHIRIAVRPPEDTARLLAALEELLR